MTNNDNINTNNSSNDNSNDNSNNINIWIYFDFLFYLFLWQIFIIIMELINRKIKAPLDNLIIVTCWIAFRPLGTLIIWIFFIIEINFSELNYFILLLLVILRVWNVRQNCRTIYWWLKAAVRYVNELYIQQSKTPIFSFLFFAFFLSFPLLRSHYFIALLYFYSCFYFVCRSSSITLLGFYFISVCRVCITVDHRFFSLFLYLVLSPSLSLSLPVSLHLSHSLPYNILRSPVILCHLIILHIICLFSYFSFTIIE